MSPEREPSIDLAYWRERAETAEGDRDGWRQAAGQEREYAKRAEVEVAQSRESLRAVVALLMKHHDVGSVMKVELWGHQCPLCTDLQETLDAARAFLGES